MFSIGRLRLRFIRPWSWTMESLAAELYECRFLSPLQTRRSKGELVFWQAGRSRELSILNRLLKVRLDSGYFGAFWCILETGVRFLIISSIMMRNESYHVSTGGGFFPFDDHDTNFLLEDSQAAVDSTVPCCLCRCGQKKLEVSNPHKVRSFLSHLPEVEEEVDMPFPYGQHWNCISPPSDEEFSYNSYSQSIRDWGRSPNDELEFSFSDPLHLRSTVGVPCFYTNTDEKFQRVSREKEPLMVSSPSHCNFQTRDGRDMLLYTPVKFRRSGDSFLDPMSGCRNLQHQGSQSPGFDAQYFRNGHGVVVPSIIQPKQAINNSVTELPSSSSVSVSSDETEHPQLKVELYKTELCRSWEETGYCRYAAKCQFAHGSDDLRPVPRHPKYKTELCRSYTETGLCSYGKRCRFIHSSKPVSQAFTSTTDLERKFSRRLSIFEQLSGASETTPLRQA